MDIHQSPSTLDGLRENYMDAFSFSSDLCDLVFWYHVEKYVFPEEVLSRHGIKCWVRFRNDILAVVTCPVFFRRFLTNVKARCSGIWTVAVEQWSSHSVSFLHLCVQLDGSWLAWTPFRKPSPAVFSCLCMLRIATSQVCIGGQSQRPLVWLAILILLPLTRSTS